MRNMKPSIGAWRGLATLAIAAGFLLLLSGCQNPMATDSARAGGETGTLSLSIGGPGAARTILPEGQARDFASFRLVFTREGDASLPPVVWTDLSDQIDLRVGRWNLVVTALNSEGDQVAGGSLLGFDILPNGTTFGRVVLSPMGDGDGTFAWDMDLSDVTDLVSANMAVTGLREAGGEVTVMMWDREGNGWDGNAALRINVNGVDVDPNARLWTTDGHGPVSHTFNVNSGDVVRFYWVGGNQWDAENAFAVFFSDSPPGPGVFSPGNATPVNDPEGTLLLYRQYLAEGTGSIGSGAFMGSFAVGTVESVNLMDPASNPGSLELPSGVYRVVFRLENAEGDVAAFSEILHVYAGMTSRRGEVFTDVHFLVSVLDIILRSRGDEEWDLEGVTPAHFTVSGVSGVYDVDALEDRLNTPALFAVAYRAVDLRTLRQLVDAALVGIAGGDSDVLERNFANRGEAETFVRSVVRNGTAIWFDWSGDVLTVSVDVDGQNVEIDFAFTGSIPVGTLLRENVWEDGMFTRAMLDAGEVEVFFRFQVEAGKTYRIWWSSIWGGELGNIPMQVSASHSDGTPIFSIEGDGWNAPQTFIAGSDGTVQVTIDSRPWWNTGIFSIVYSTGDTRPSFFPANAIPLAGDTATAGAIIGAGGEVWYSFEIEAGEQYFLWFNDGFQGDGAKTLNATVNAWFEDESRVISFSQNSAYRFPSSFAAWEAGTFYVRITPNSFDQTGTFAIAYTTVNRSPWFHPPATIALTENRWQEGAITAQPWGEAWFSLDVEEGETYRIWYNSAGDGDGSHNFWGYIYIFDDDGTFIYRRSNAWGSPLQPFTAGSTGTLYVMVTTQNPFGGTGTFAVAYSTGSDRPMMGLVPDDATPLANGVVMDGTIGSDGAAWFSFEAEAGIHHHLWWNDVYQGDGTQSVAVNVAVFDRSEAVISGMMNRGYLFPWSTLSSGTFYVRVTPMNTGETGSFQIMYTTAEGPPWFAPSDVTVLTENQWRAGTITPPGGAAWFSFDVVEGQTYYVWWNDASQGQGYNLWGWLGAFSGDGTVVLLRNSGWIYPSQFTPGFTGTVYIPVMAQSTWGEGSFAVAYSTSPSRPSSAIETMFDMHELTEAQAAVHFAGRGNRGSVTIGTTPGGDLVASAGDWVSTAGEGIHDPGNWNWSPLTVLPANLAGVQPGDALSVTITFEGLPGGIWGDFGLRPIGTEGPGAWVQIQSIVPEYTMTRRLTLQDVAGGLELAYNLWNFPIDMGDLETVAQFLENFVVSITNLTVTGYER